MQPLPIRLVQSTRLAFRSSRPLVRHTKPILHFSGPQQAPLHQPCLFRHHVVHARLYSTERDFKKEEQSITKEAEILQSSKDEAASKSSADLARSRSPEPPLTDPNLDAPTTSPSSSSSFESLPSRAQSRRTEISKRFSHLMDNFQSNIFVASQRLNDLTGYSGIEALKKEIEAQEAKVQSTRAAVKEARSKYSAAVSTRSTTQREVNDLLQRKHNWSPADLERFTSLYRSDHANEQAETAAQDALGRAEREAEEASSRLARTILARYHEEQIWSDKIRQMSTWGTWGLMGLNVLLFIVFQIAIEPWRRRRLVKGFEEKVMEALEREGGAGVGGATGVAAVRNRMDQVRETMDPKEQLPALEASVQADVESAVEAVVDAEIAQAAVEEVAQMEPTLVEELPTDQSAFTEPASGYAYYKEAFRELFSEKKVLTVTQKDLTTVALEGAAGGAALTGLLLVLLRPR
jgi:sensitive to high expression protein 9, mitochondrial